MEIGEMRRPHNYVVDLARRKTMAKQ